MDKAKLDPGTKFTLLDVRELVKTFPIRAGLDRKSVV